MVVSVCLPSVPTFSVGFLLPWTWAISSRLPLLTLDVGYLLLVATLHRAVPCNLFKFSLTNSYQLSTNTFTSSTICSVGNLLSTKKNMDFPGDSDGKESAYNAGDSGSIPGLGRSPEEENGYPLQYSCLENSMDRGAWQAKGVTKSPTQLSDQHYFFHEEYKKISKFVNVAPCFQ